MPAGNVIKFRYIVWSSMDYRIIGFFIYQHWKYVIIKLISVYTTERFHINSSIWWTHFKFILTYSFQITVTYNIRVLLFFGSDDSNVGFNSSWKFWGVAHILIFWVFFGNCNGTLEVFCKFFVSHFLVEVASSITIILFSNVTPFNLRISFCTCSSTNANAKPLRLPLH